tara:strand:+ start:151 stop:378 length:228 start_codon:yes stop_codon:yes gene_type:complete
LINYYFEEAGLKIKYANNITELNSKIIDARANWSYWRCSRIVRNVVLGWRWNIKFPVRGSKIGCPKICHMQYPTM